MKGVLKYCMFVIWTILALGVGNRLGARLDVELLTKIAAGLMILIIGIGIGRASGGKKVNHVKINPVVNETETKIP